MQARRVSAHPCLALLPGVSQTRLRKAIYTAIRTFQAKHGLAEPKDMIDVRLRWSLPACCFEGLELACRGCLMR